MGITALDAIMVIAVMFGVPVVIWPMIVAVAASAGILVPVHAPCSVLDG